MEIIGRDKFEEAENMKPTLKEGAKIEKLTDDEFTDLLKKMNDPVNFQKELAVRIKHFLDHQMQRDMEKTGILSDHTRRWVESYHKILDRLQSAIHGDKSVNLHLHKVSHGDIAAKIRELK